MKKLLSVLVLCLSVAGCASVQQGELSCFILDPDTEGPTDICAKPGGKVVFQVDSYDFDCGLVLFWFPINNTGSPENGIAGRADDDAVFQLDFEGQGFWFDIFRFHNPVNL